MFDDVLPTKLLLRHKFIKRLVLIILCEFFLTLILTSVIIKNKQKITFIVRNMFIAVY